MEPIRSSLPILPARAISSCCRQPAIGPCGNRRLWRSGPVVRVPGSEIKILQISSPDFSRPFVGVPTLVGVWLRLGRLKPVHQRAHGENRVIAITLDFKERYR